MVNQNNSKKRLLYKISCAVGCLILFLIMGVATYILHDISEIDEPLEYSASLEFNKELFYEIKEKQLKIYVYAHCCPLKIVDG